MDTDPAWTFVDMNAVSMYKPGRALVKPNYDVTLTWTKVRVNITRCLIFLYRWGTTFADYDNPVTYPDNELSYGYAMARSLWR